MSYSAEKDEDTNTEDPPLKKPRLRPLNLQDPTLKHVIAKMRFHTLSSSTPSPSPSSPSSDHSFSPMYPTFPDLTSLLSDELLLLILSKLYFTQYLHNSLVCKRWLHLHGRLIRSLKVLDWGFLDSGRVFERFPNLTDIDIVYACIRSPKNSGILVTRKAFSVHIDSLFTPNGFIQEEDVFRQSVIDGGLKLLAEWYPNLRRVVAIGGSENGLMGIARECDKLQELELHCCGDLALKGISGCRNLQIVKLTGSVDGFFSSVISDIGLTILAQGCRRLVKLELCGCEGSYDGIKAIGQCCQMLEELTLCDNRMEGGWLAALSYCGNLKTLRLRSCKSIDLSPGPDEHLGSCPTIEGLYLQKCQVRDKEGVKALFLVCKAVREIVLQDCWGLVDDVFSLATICRYKISSLFFPSILTA